MVSPRTAGPAGIAFDGAGRLYVANSNSILIYAAGATGDATPVATIAGPSTGLAGAKTPAFDGTGRLYVVISNTSITVYAAGATGDASPIATITGPSTGLSAPLGVAVGP
jgi:hypothetical protein